MSAYYRASSPSWVTRIATFWFVILSIIAMTLRLYTTEAASALRPECQQTQLAIQQTHLAIQQAQIHLDAKTVSAETVRGPHLSKSKRELTSHTQTHLLFYARVAVFFLAGP
jgi:hypothetical protein